MDDKIGRIRMISLGDENRKTTNGRHLQAIVTGGRWKRKMM